MEHFAKLYFSEILTVYGYFGTIFNLFYYHFERKLSLIKGTYCYEIKIKYKFYSIRYEYKIDKQCTSKIQLKIIIHNSILYELNILNLSYLFRHIYVFICYENNLTSYD